VKVGLDGFHWAEVVGYFASKAHIVPTAVAYKGNFFVGDLACHWYLPFMGDYTKWYNERPATGLRAIVGLALDKPKYLRAGTQSTFPSSRGG